MNENSFRLVSGLSIVVVHAMLCIAGYALLNGRMENGKVLPSLLILVPVFGVFASQVVNYLAQNPSVPRRGKKLAGLFVSVFFALLVAHAVLVLQIFYSFAFAQTIRTPEELQQFLGFAESAFGFLIGILVTRTFGAAPEAT